MMNHDYLTCPVVSDKAFILTSLINTNMNKNITIFGIDIIRVALKTFARGSWHTLDMLTRDKLTGDMLTRDKLTRDMLTRDKRQLPQQIYNGSMSYQIPRVTDTCLIFLIIMLYTGSHRSMDTLYIIRARKVGGQWLCGSTIYTVINQRLIDITKGSLHADFLFPRYNNCIPPSTSSNHRQQLPYGALWHLHRSTCHQVPRVGDDARRPTDPPTCSEGFQGHTLLRAAYPLERVCTVLCCKIFSTQFAWFLGWRDLCKNGKAIKQYKNKQSQYNGTHPSSLPCSQDEADKEQGSEWTSWWTSRQGI